MKHLFIALALVVVAIGSAFTYQEINPGRAVAQKYMDKYVYLMSLPDRPYEIIEVPDFTYKQLVFTKPADYYETAIETALKKFKKYNLEFDGMIMNGEGSADFIKFTE